MNAPPRYTCVRDGQIICPDDLCRGTSHTLCGLEEGIDFGTDDEWDDEWDDVSEPCPMGCGGLTFDPAGGPCERCWDKAPRT